MPASIKPDAPASTQSSRALRALGYRYCRPSALAATALWAFPFLALAIWLSLWRSLGLIDADVTGEAIITAYAAFGAGIAAALLREPIFLALDKLASLRGALSWGATFAATVARDVACLAFAARSAMVALELPWNDELAEMAQPYVSHELTLITLALVILYFVSQRRGALVAAGVAAFAGCGLAQYFVLIFKGAAITPSDVLSLDTALSVSSNYIYTISPLALEGIVTATWAAVACCLIKPLGASPRVSGLQAARKNPKAKRFSRPSPSPLPRRTLLIARGANIALNLVVATACCFSLHGRVVGIDYDKELDITIDPWVPIESYSQQGILSTFIASVQNMAITVPDGYTDERAQELEATYSATYEAKRASTPEHAAATQQFSDQEPSVVVVMNETFSDLSSMYGDLGLGYMGPENFNAIDDALVRGRLAVPAYGGGTCNSEFEFLTSNALAFVGTDKYPYTLYNLDNSASIAKQFKALGYDTAAIHPNLGSNWSRDVAYASLGFDRFYTIDDYTTAPEYHSGATDAATYETILDRLRNNEAPQFVFDVTMQNHSGYNQGNIPEDELRGYELEGFDAEQNAALNEYLACIDASDRDLAWLIAELRKLDRPVVLVFFGDHQPNFGNDINNLLFEDTGGVSHGARMYLTNYLVWANYDVAGAGEMRVEDASANTLAALALDAVGAPLTDVQAAQLGARQDLPMLGLYAYEDLAGAWHTTIINPETRPTTEQPTGDTITEAGVSAPPATDAEIRARAAFDALANIQYRRFATKVQ